MPWRKYSKKEGVYGPIYYITKGVQVRRIKCGNWVLYMEKDGVRKNRAFGKNREALIEAVNGAEKLVSNMTAAKSAQAAKDSQDEAETKVPKFRKYSNVWLQNNAGRWHANTYQRYEEILRLHILTDTDFKTKRLDEIERQHVKQFLVKLFRIRSAATVETAHSVVHGIFEDAIDDKLAKSNPAKGLLKKILPAKRQRNDKDSDPFDLEERDIFLDHAEQICTLREQFLLKVMLHMGLRLGEALAMKVRHFDFRKMTYHVTESFKRKKFGQPKGAKKRWVDIPAFFASEIKEFILHLKKENLKKGKGGEVDLLFLDPKVNHLFPYSQNKIQGLLKRVCRAAGFRYRNPHDLRHTYATILLMAHMSPAYVQKQMGHSSICITVDTYGHWIAGEGRQGLEEALSGSVRNLGENRILPHLKQNDLSK